MSLEVLGAISGPGHEPGPRGGSQPENKVNTRLALTRLISHKLRNRANNSIWYLGPVMWLLVRELITSLLT